MSSSTYLEATYTSPSSGPLHLSTKLHFPSSSVVSDNRESSSLSLPVKEKTAYLRSLRQATGALQERVNAELTAQMDEDNRRAQGDHPLSVDGSAEENGDKGRGKKTKNNQGRVDEAAEEENYGEEVQGGDDEE
ncbi:hypothetical protein F5X99DRAFT_65938 [Biscogniauxia marginata]|nr:hypothetical protein F5X99DRAFT_65938 [Biscogniauxia marginata]